MKTDAVINHIVNWLTRYIEQTSLEGFVVGVSGGIDSAVTSTLCARTGKKTIVLNMPIYQAEDQVSRSSRHIDWLKKQYDNVENFDIDLSSVFDQVKATLPAEIDDGLTLANTRSRLRMVTLYAFAGHRKLLVAGTGNKVEDFGVGFYTKYGDGGVDVAPIADLMKSEVYEVGRTLGLVDAILTAPPTDGLWQDNRTDESQIGASYAELEWAMQYQAGLLDEQTLSVRQKEILQIYTRFHQANRHKMEPIPVARIPDRFR